jgi:hypothetical protein
MDAGRVATRRDALVAQHDWLTARVGDHRIEQTGAEGPQLIFRCLNVDAEPSRRDAERLSADAEIGGRVG